MNLMYISDGNLDDVLNEPARPFFSVAPNSFSPSAKPIFFSSVISAQQTIVWYDGLDRLPPLFLSLLRPLSLPLVSLFSLLLVDGKGEEAKSSHVSDISVLVLELVSESVK